MSQITTCTFFKLKGFQNKFWAFTQMQLGHAQLKNIKGLIFYKLMGSGAENGFSSVPNFGTYALLCIWEGEKYAVDYFENNAFFKKYESKSMERFTVFANAAEAHGHWDKQQPFEFNATLVRNQPVMVLTRASIKWSKLISFWRRVGHVSKSLESYKGLALSIGIGEWPLIQQATLSIWKSQAEMMDYAYKNKNHREVVQLTRKLGWYKEELFARFVPFKYSGQWNGVDIARFLKMAESPN
jgi:hypothetical protein